MKRAEGLSVSDAQTPTLKPPPRQELHAAGMRVVQAKLSRDMCPDLSRRSTELSVQPNAQRRFVGRCHAGPPPPYTRRCKARPSREWCRRLCTKTLRWLGRTSRHQATRSHWRAAQHSGLRAGCELRPQAHGSGRERKPWEIRNLPEAPSARTSPHQNSGLR
jgi:hypothetical protein